MNTQSMIGELLKQRGEIDSAILALQRLGGAKRRGRPPGSANSIVAPKRRGRPTNAEIEARKAAEKKGRKA